MLPLKVCALALAFSVPASIAIAETIIVQSTTSTQNSGLLDFLLPKFTKKNSIKVHVVAVGTGQALKNGRNGDGDILLVHSKDAEEQFVLNGFGVKRFDVMYNDFILVGPANDPAKIAGSTNVLDALGKVARSQSAFASRGDDSGTNKKERQLWAKAGVNVQKSSGKWYRETGSGMGATLNITVGMNAYTMSDRATWLAFGNKQNMKIVFEGDPQLFNQYGIILVNPARHPHVKAKAAQIFIDWINGDEGQSLIAAFKIDGKQLFFPNAKK